MLNNLSSPLPKTSANLLNDFSIALAASNSAAVNWLDDIGLNFGLYLGGGNPVLGSTLALVM